MHPLPPNARPLSQVEVHARVADLLRAVVNACDREGVEVVVISGSCLGVVRHAGKLIPWDDDADLAVPAAQMPAFVAAMRHLPPHMKCRPFGPVRLNRFEVVDLGTRTFGRDADRPNAEPWGIRLDIMPSLLWRNAARKRVDVTIAMLADLDAATASGGPWHLRAKRFAAQFRPQVTAVRLQQGWWRAAAEADDRRLRARGAGIVTGSVGSRWGVNVPHDVFYPLRRATLEGVDVNVPGDVHAYLRVQYGPDYLTPPPPDQRAGHFERAFALPDAP